MKKRTVALLLALVLAVGTLAGCGSKEKQEETPKTEVTQEQAESTEKKEEASAEEAGPVPVDYFAGTELTVAIHKNALDASTNWEDKEIVKMAEEATGIHINWVIVDDAVKKERVASILSSGELPDIMLGLVETTDLTTNKELFYDLSEEGLLEKYAPNVLEDYENGGQEVLEFLKHSDGSIRSLAGNTGSNAPSDAGYMWMINTTWLKQLGMEIPTNAEEFYNVLCAFRDNDMNGNGDKTDEIPLSFCGVDGNFGFLHLADAFGIVGEDHKNWNYYQQMKDGKVSSSVDTQEFRSYLEFSHKLAEEGLIDVEGFSQTREQYTAKTAANRVGVLFAWNAATHVKVSGDDYTFMLPFQGLDGVEAGMTGIDGDTYFNASAFVISAESENVEAALHWWNYLSSDAETFCMCRYGQYYYDENGVIRGGMDPKLKEAGVSYPSDYTLGIGNASPYAGPHEFPNPLTKDNVRYDITMEAKEKGYLRVGLGDEVMIDKFVDPDVLSDRTMIEVDLLPMIDAFVANSVVDGVTDDSWNKFQNDLKTYRYYEWIEWWQNYVDGNF